MEKLISRVRWLLIFFLVLIVISCVKREKFIVNEASRTTETYYQINLPGKFEETFCQASSFADTVIYVPLETSSISLLGDVKQIAFDDSYIVVSDTRQIMVFDYSGRFIRQIGKSGAGPGEFSFIFNFVLKHDTLFIRSKGKNGIDKYNIDGSYLGFVEQNFNSSHFCAMEHGFAWYDWIYGHVVYFDENWNSIDTLVVENQASERSENNMTYSTDDIYLFKSKNKLLFYNYLTDTVWDITNRSKEPAVILNLKNKLLPKNLFVENYPDYGNWKEKASQYLRVNFMQTDSFAFIIEHPWTKSLSSLYVYNRNTLDIKKYNIPAVYDDIMGQRPVLIWHYTDNSVVGIMDFGSLEDGYEKADSPTVKEFWANLLHEADENDNQILVLFKVK